VFVDSNSPSLLIQALMFTFIIIVLGTVVALSYFQLFLDNNVSSNFGIGVREVSAYITGVVLFVVTQVGSNILCCRC
jgi:cytochrome c oxidase assembly factor CtaG